MNLPYPDNSFDGNWSFGVIEHFWNGYDAIVQEAYRVLKPGGHLFMTFLTLSPLRHVKLKLGLYRPLPETMQNGGSAPHGFYQFFLSSQKVYSRLERLGFSVMEQFLHTVESGLKQDLPLAWHALRLIGKPLPGNLRRGVVTVGERKLSSIMGHLSVVVAKKSEV